MNLKWQDVLKEYCQKAFGAGAPAMEKYYHLLVNAERNGGHEAGSVHAIPHVFDRDFVKQAKALVAEAGSSAKTDRDKKMVDYFGQSVTMLEMYHDYRDATLAYDFANAKKHLDRMESHWQKYLDMNSHLVSRYGHRYYFRWLLGPYIDMATKYSSEPYDIIHEFPDALPTIFDPTDSGALMGLYRPEIKDEHRLETRTYGMPWDAQGLGPYRDGGVWYRVRFPVDKSLEGQGVGLMIGAVEDTVHVWVNGEYVGMGRGFVKPFAFDLTDGIKYGEENLVALQVIRRSPLNEAGLGGLLYPSFVFTGPQLEEKAPLIEPMRRILPGGARGAVEE